MTDSATNCVVTNDRDLNYFITSYNINDFIISEFKVNDTKM